MHRDRIDGTMKGIVKDGVSVRIYHVYDTCPDLSFLGKFTNEWSEGAIEHNLDDSRTFNYFKPANHGRFNPKNWEHVDPEAKDKVIQEYGSFEKAEKAYARQDYERMLSLERGDWYMMGIVAEVVISGKVLGEGSVWGVESDGNQVYFEEIENDCAAEAVADFNKTRMDICGVNFGKPVL